MTIASTVVSGASRSWFRPGPFALTLPALLLLTLLFMLPLARLFSLSFAGGGFGWYEKALTGGLYTAVLYRTFEIAGCGGFQLCDKFQDAWFTDGREIARFTTPADLRAAVIRYLDQEDQRSAIASAARVRAVQEHTFKHRFAILLDALEGLS